MNQITTPWRFLIRLLLFWLLYFAIFRLWFVLWFHERWSADAPGGVWASFWHALPLDVSMAAYLIAVPVIFWFIGLGIGRTAYPVVEKMILGFNVFLFSGLVFVYGANVFLYEEWHTPLNNRALEYMATPAALLDSMSGIFIAASIGIYIGFVWLWYRVYKYMVGRKLYEPAVSRWNIAVLPLQLALLAFAIRGGSGVMPINESAVYYSAHLFDNHAATNTSWHLLHSLIETRSTVNHFKSMHETEAGNRVKRLFEANIASGDGSYTWFEGPAGNRLNVVFIIMESMTAQVMEELGGEKGVCPNLSRIIKEGILFGNCYGSGYRTDQGLVSILAGYPAQPDQSVVLLSDKAEKLPSLPKTLHENGYATAYYYGGELTFANIGVWLRDQQFERIISEQDFPASDKTQRWGVDDQRLLQRFALEINDLKKPFFATAMTLSLHPPYDVPYKSKWEGESNRDKFLHSAAFADYAIGEFFKTAEQQDWYANTLFVLVADHGNSSPNEVGMDNPASRKIPLILFGAPLNKNWKGRKIDTFANHHDIPATILRMMEQPAKDFAWSRDLWLGNGIGNTHTAEARKNLGGFAYYTNENGLGWINRDGAGFYQFENKEWQIWQGQLDSNSRTDARAYLQVLYDDFLRL